MSVDYSAKLGLDEGAVSHSIVDLGLAEQLLKVSPGDQRAQALLVKKRQMRRQQAEASRRRVHELVSVAKSGKGDPSKGKPMFKALCLNCHAVGSEGAGFSPALDGSAHRSPEELLTAILDPDAAVEGNYSLYRIFKKDGSTVEGYLEEAGRTGVKVAFYGRRRTARAGDGNCFRRLCRG